MDQRLRDDAAWAHRQDLLRRGEHAAYVRYRHLSLGHLLGRVLGQNGFVQVHHVTLATPLAVWLRIEDLPVIDRARATRADLDVPRTPTWGDRTPVELFLRGAASIESHIRRLIIAFVQGTPPENKSRWLPGGQTCRLP